MEGEEGRRVANNVTQPQRFETTEAVLAGRYDTNSTFAVVNACIHYDRDISTAIRLLSHRVATRIVEELLVEE